MSVPPEQYYVAKAMMPSFFPPLGSAIVRPHRGPASPILSSADLVRRSSRGRRRREALRPRETTPCERASRSFGRRFRSTQAGECGGSATVPSPETTATTQALHSKRRACQLRHPNAPINVWRPQPTKITCGALVSAYGRGTSYEPPARRSSCAHLYDARASASPDHTFFTR